MQIKIITIKFNPLTESFDDTSLVDFVKDKELISVREHFFIKNDMPYLVIMITFNLKDTIEEKREKKILKETWRDLLTDEDMPLFNTLRAWRGEKARKNGIAPYMVCNNHQLALMVKNSPQSLNALLEIKGFGKSRVEKYGAEILDILGKSEVQS